MEYVVKIRMRDTEIQCSDEDDMNEKVADIQQDFTQLGIPDQNYIIRKELHQDCSLGHTHNDLIEQIGE